LTQVRVVVADDEKPAGERVRRLLAREDRVEIVGCCANGAEALAAIREAASARQPVQVLFLDIQMPGLDGFGVLSQLLDEGRASDVPAVAFVTAHDEFAIPAFESP